MRWCVPVFDHHPQAIFQIYLHYKMLWWKKKKKSISCALITDYYNPMSKHLSCQHLRYELLPHDCDAIWISPHATSYVKKSLSNHSSNVRKAAHRASCRPQDLRYAQFHRTIWGLKSRLRNISACHPLLLFFLPLLPRHPPPPTRGQKTWLNLDKYTQCWTCNYQDFQL